MQRRKFVIGLGALSTGSAAAMGTGAFTTATLEDRSVTVDVSGDADAQIALMGGNDPDISANESGALELDLSGDEGEGVNIDSVYTWGDSESPESNYAFKIVNQDDSGQSYSMTLTYDYDRSWVNGSASWDQNYQSYIEFEVFDGDGHFAGRPKWARSQQWPDQGQHGSRGEDTPLTLGDGNAENRALNPGETWYIVVRVDTSGEDASTDDKLAGQATFEFNSYNE
ncbi:hypothetical protein [Halorubrum sp. F4]|uniref:hypothetical protein n=1 Tax=Halorubrum sp. F4 TaxID=2989715 RepID=UPI00248024E5|nr:hypothetical protein [Halorubrum sp. F4]